MIIFMLVLLGLIFGSFVNACVWRLHEQQSRGRKQKVDADLSIVTGRSRCTHCGHTLSVWDLVPVASYVWLRGKCRYCGKPIDDNPLAELLLPALFVASYIWWPYSLADTPISFGQVFFVAWLAALVGFAILAIYDFKWYLLPDRIVFPLIGLSLLVVALHIVVFAGGIEVLMAAFGGVICTAGLFYLLYLISRGAWIGFGDVKLAIALGLLAGGPLNALLVIFLASLTGSLAALPLLVRGKPIGKTRIPFGPFLLVATFVAVLFGDQLTSWYSSLLIR